MLSINEINEFSNNYANILTNNNFESRRTLEDFRKKEKSLKLYNEKLNELEKEQRSSNLYIFQSYQSSIIEKIKENFKPNNLDYTLKYLDHVIEQINIQKDDLNSVALEAKLIKQTWKNYKKSNKNLDKNWIDTLINEAFFNMDSSLNNFTIDDVGGVLTEITILKERVNKVIDGLDFLREGYNQYLYIGEEAKALKAEITNTNSQEFESINKFINQVTSLKGKIEIIKEESTLTNVRIPVKEVKKKNTEHIKNYTLKFNENLLKYNSFFFEGIEEFDTEEYIYFKNYPKKGIFKGSDLIEDFDYKDEYLQGVKVYNKLIDNLFISIFGIIIVLLTISFNPYFFIPICLALLIGSWLTSHFIKNYIEKKYKIFSFFPYIEINKIIFKDGYDIDLEEIFQGIIFNIDDTMIELKEEELYL